MNFFDELMSDPSKFLILVAVVSFLLGLLVGWLIWGGKARARQLELDKLRREHDSLKKEHAEIKEKHTVTEAGLKATTEELDDLKVKKRQLENEKGQLYADLFSTKKELASLESDVNSANEESSFFINSLATKLAEARGEKPKGIKMGAAPEAKKEKKKDTPAPKTPKGIKADDLKIIEGIGPKIAKLMSEGGVKTWADMAAAKVERLQEILDAAGPRYRIHNPGTWPQQAALARDGKWDALKKLQDELQGGK